MDPETLSGIQRELVALARGRFGLQPADAEDAAQTTVARILAQDYKTITSALAVKVLASVIMDRWRGEQAARRAESQRQQPTPVSSENEFRELKIAFYRTLSRTLTDQERRAFLLKGEGHSVREIAVALGVTQWAVRRSLDAVLHKLETTLADFPELIRLLRELLPAPIAKAEESQLPER